MIYPDLTSQKQRDRVAREMRRLRQKRDEQHKTFEPLPVSSERALHISTWQYYKGLLCGYRRALQDFYDY